MSTRIRPVFHSSAIRDPFPCPGNIAQQRKCWVHSNERFFIEDGLSKRKMPSNNALFELESKEITEKLIEMVLKHSTVSHRD